MGFLEKIKKFVGIGGSKSSRPGSRVDPNASESPESPESHESEQRTEKNKAHLSAGVLPSVAQISSGGTTPTETDKEETNQADNEEKARKVEKKDAEKPKQPEDHTPPSIFNAFLSAASEGTYDTLSVTGRALKRVAPTKTIPVAAKAAARKVGWNKAKSQFQERGIKNKIVGATKLAGSGLAATVTGVAAIGAVVPLTCMGIAHDTIGAMGVKLRSMIGSEGEGVFAKFGRMLPNEEHQSLDQKMTAGLERVLGPSDAVVKDSKGDLFRASKVRNDNGGTLPQGYTKAENIAEDAKGGLFEEGLPLYSLGPSGQLKKAAELPKEDMELAQQANAATHEGNNPPTNNIGGDAENDTAESLGENSAEQPPPADQQTVPEQLSVVEHSAATLDTVRQGDAAAAPANIASGHEITFTDMAIALQKMNNF